MLHARSFQFLTPAGSQLASLSFESSIARVTGLEPVAYGFGDRHSTY